MNKKIDYLMNEREKRGKEEDRKKKRRGERFKRGIEIEGKEG